MESKDKILSKIEQQLAPFDSLDLISKLSGLRLLPHNGYRLLRLDLLLHSASSIKHHIGPKIKRKKLKEITNSSIIAEHIARYEDPPSQGLCEEITFFGGGYRIFPGVYQSIVFNLKHLLKCLFLSKQSYLPEKLRDEFLRSALFILSVSEEIAKRAKIDRYTNVLYRANLYVPHENELDGLAKSVLFSKSEIEKMAVKSRLTLGDLSWIFSNIGEVDANSFDFESGQLFASPIMQIEENFVVTDSSSLLNGFRKRVKQRLIEEKLLDKFSKSYYRAIWDSAIKYLDWMGIKRVDCLPEKFHNDIPVIDGVFSFDSNKALIVFLINDSFQEPEKNFIRINCNSLNGRINALLEELSPLNTPSNEFMCLYLYSMFDRAISFDIENPSSDLKVLTLTVDSLEIISILEGGKNLFLYKYALAHDRISRSSEIISDPLSEYGYFRNRGYSYYSGDEVIPELLTLNDDFALSTRMEALKKNDLHSVFNPDGNSYMEVLRLHDESLPLYIPSLISSSIQVILENPTLAIWFFNSDDLSGDIRSIACEFVDMLGYWFNEMKNYMDVLLDPLCRHIKHLILYVKFLDPKNWDKPFFKEDLTEKSKVLDITFHPPDSIEIEFHPEINAFIYGETNEGERFILTQFLKSMSKLYNHFGVSDHNLSDQIIQENIDKFMPLGRKKKLSAYNSLIVPEIDPRDIPMARFVDDIDVNLLLDEIGEAVRNKEVKIGDNNKEQAEFINEHIVGYLWEKLQGEIRKVNGDELLYYLILQNEALTRERVLHEMQLPMRLEIRDPERVLDEFYETNNKIVESSPACRFLVECAICMYPNGLNHVSDALYDRLLAIAEEIIGWGFTSDLVINEIGNMRVRILPSGRIGRSEKEYKKAYARFSEQSLRRQISVLSNKFESYWERETSIDDDFENDTFVGEINSALKKEFGFTWVDFGRFNTVLFEIAEQMGKTIIKVSRDRLLDELRGKVNSEAALAIIKSHSLCQRENFFSYPNYKRIQMHEFYPWRFNRLFSYIRRPLLEIQSEKGILILYGLRHWRTAMKNFYSLFRTGRITKHAKTKEFSRLLTKIVQPHGTNFNEKVANVFKGNKKFKVSKNKTKFGKVRIEANKGEDLGDIDVLAIDTKAHKILIIECKDLLIARTPYELNLERKKTFVDENSQIERHLRRAEWVKKNIQIVLDNFGLDNRKKWKVKSLFIVNEPLFSSHFRNNPGLEILTFDELAKRYG